MVHTNDGQSNVPGQSNVLGLRCRECAREYPVSPIYTCEWCFGPLEVAYDYDAIAASVTREKIAAGPLSLWRYSDLLPVDADAAVDLGTGFTPLVRADRLASALGLGEVWLKNDTRNPTNSFKDRVVSIALSKALEFGFKVAACASTGNLANSVAAHAARAGLRSFVFIPSNLERAKVVTTAVYGGNVIAIEGNYDDVNRLCAELAGTYHWAFVNVNVRPFYAEGSKTLAYETVEQLGWTLPDRVVSPIASGSLFTKLGRGFQEWLDLGLVEGEQPTFNGAQAEGCSPVATAFAEGWDVCKPQRPDTIAKSLAIGDPADGPYAVEQARRTGGGVDSVSDDEIRSAIKLLAETTGIFTETAGGVTVGVLRKLAERGELAAGEKVVVYITGEGLKTLDATRDTFRMHEIDPSLDSFDSEFAQGVIA